MVLFSTILAGCGGAPMNSNAGNTTTANNPLETTKPAPEAVTNNAPTLTPVFKAYCEAWMKNDEAALRKVYSSETLKSFEADMKADKVKSLIKLLEDDKISGRPCDIRNEVITGDTAVATVRADAYPNGLQFVFVKENAEWKLTDKVPAVDSVKRTAVNSNTVK